MRPGRSSTWSDGYRIPLIKGCVISLETAVRMLRDAGYPIEDVAEEVERIHQRAFEQAALSRMPPATTPRYANYLGLREADPGIHPCGATAGRPRPCRAAGT
jgi:hypothetical protein